MSRLKVDCHYIEVNKPSGGGNGEEALYWIDISIDGEFAFRLDRPDFAKTGQMHALAEIIKGNARCGAA